jgi:hypothetical protein
MAEGSMRPAKGRPPGAVLGIFVLAASGCFGPFTQFFHDPNEDAGAIGTGGGASGAGGGAAGGGGQGTCDEGSELSGDPQNCGRCGHSCLGGPCMGGMCQPWILASGQYMPTGLSVSDGWVYWVNQVPNGAAMRVRTDGTQPTVIAPNQFNPIYIVADDTHVWWSTNEAAGSSVSRAPLNGGPVERFISGQTFTEGVTIDAQNVYWSNASGAQGGLFRWPKSAPPTSAGIAMATGSYLRGTSNDGRRVFWSDATLGLVQSVDTDGGSYFIHASAQNTPLLIDLRDGYLYWPAYGSGDVRRATLDGGVPETLASGEQHPFFVVSDARAVYWCGDNVIGLAAGGYVAMRPLDGGARQQLAADGTQAPLGMTQDEDALYYGTGALPDGRGYIWKVAKP